MYLHIGGDTSIRAEEIVLILDSEGLRKDKATRRFLEQAGNARRIRDLSGGEPKAYVVTEEYVYITSISPSALKRRAEAFSRSSLN